MIFMNGDDSISISLDDSGINKAMNIPPPPQQQHSNNQILHHQPSTSSGAMSNVHMPSSSLAYATPTMSIPSSGRRRKPKQIPKTGPLSLDNFWPSTLDEVKAVKQVDAKNQSLPLARIKKIMKLDENAKMIAAEAPLLFAKACEYFIQELTLRAWVHTEENKRRTLQRSDIATAISRCDQFDFLIDIVPREEIKPSSSGSSSVNTKKETTNTLNTNNISTDTKPPTMVSDTSGSGVSDQIQYFLQLGGLTNPNASMTAQQTSPQQQITLQAPQLQTLNQTLPLNQLGTQGIVMSPQNLILNAAAQQQLVQAALQHQQQQMIQQQQQPQQLQLFQQILTSNGEIQNIPITINPNQLGLLRMQIQGNNLANQIPQQQQIIFQQPTGPHLVQLNTGSGQILQQTSPQLFINQAISQQQQQQQQQQQSQNPSGTKMLNQFQNNC